MSKLIIRNLFQKEIRVGKEEQTVLKLLHSEYVDLMHACGGKGRCTTCKLSVENGEEFLSSPSAFETRCRENKVLAPNERLACQSKLSGMDEGHVVEVSIPDDYKLPHLEYSDG